MEIACNRGSDSPLVQGTIFSVWNYNPIFPRRADHPRIANSTVRAIHVPFKRNAIDDAISQFAGFVTLTRFTRSTVFLAIARLRDSNDPVPADPSPYQKLRPTVLVVQA